jgi:hypothetical protein
MRNLEGEISLSFPPSSTTKPFRHHHFLGSSYGREQGPSPNRRHKEPPLVAQRLLLLQEMFEGTGRGATRRGPFSDLFEVEGGGSRTILIEGMGPILG